METSKNTRSILFVCLGNICRSPTGEGVFLALLQEQGIEDMILVDSAGTISYHAGHAADARMRKAARNRGIKLSSRARKITHADLDTFDLVIAMDRDNLSELNAMHPEPRAEIRLLSEFVDDSWPQDVPDPYYGGTEGFEYVLDMIQAACPKLLKYIQSMP